MSRAKKITLLSLIPLFLWGEPCNQEEALFLNRIADFWEEGDHQIAKNQIIEFLHLYPNSTHVDTLAEALGDLLLKEEKYSEALEQYAKIVNPELQDHCFIHKLNCFYGLGWYTILAEACEHKLAQMSSESFDSLQVEYYLALALYHQCLNLESDHEAFVQMAMKVRPHLEKLFHSSFQEKMGLVYGEICMALQDFKTAFSIYQQLAQNDATGQCLFSAASAKAKYDQKGALDLFLALSASASLDAELRPLMNYNIFALLFELGEHETLLEKQESAPFAHYFAGKSLCELKRFKEACAKFKLAITHASSNDPLMRMAILDSFLAAYQAKDMPFLDFAIDQLPEKDPEIVRGRILKAQLFEKLAEPEKGKQELLSLLPDLPDQTHPLKPKIYLELIRLTDQMDDWISCRKSAYQFLLEFPMHPDASIVKSSLLAASLALSHQSREAKEELIADLHKLLASPDTTPPSTQILWNLLLSKTEMTLDLYSEAISHLETLKAYTDIDPLYQLHAEYLLALCYQATKQQEKLCSHGELALFLLEKETKESRFVNAKWIDRKTLHSFLYDAYLQRAASDPSFFSNAKEHLFFALQQGASVDTKTLFWLAHHNLPERSRWLYEHLLTQNLTDLEREQARLQLAKLYLQFGEKQDACNLLNTLCQTYETHPQIAWQSQAESMYLLGCELAENGSEKEALTLFEGVFKLPGTLQTEFGASACLQSARIQMHKYQVVKPKLDDPIFQKSLSQLKNLRFQRVASYEPTYLEAALDYIDFRCLCENDLTKKRILLEKTKKDFESKEDLLSKDYHYALSQDQEKRRLYQSYLQFFDAQILAAQSALEKDPSVHKELKEKANDLFVKIIEEKVHPALVARAYQCLDQ